MGRRFGLAATGGTFDVVHEGHAALLAESFAVADRVVVGLAGDGFAARRGKSPANGYAARRAALDALMRGRFGAARYDIRELDGEFGPAALEGNVEALVASEETAGRGAELNRLRRARGLPPVEVVVVPMVLAHDGRRISSTRVRNGEIDARGGQLC